jgi:capsular exopolysaccharide synthesis family protein
MSDEKRQFRLGDIVRKLREEGGATPVDPTRADTSQKAGAPEQTPAPAAAPTRRAALPRQPRFGEAPAVEADQPTESSDGESPPPLPPLGRTQIGATPGGASGAPPIRPTDGDDDGDEEEFDIYRYLSVLMRRKWVVLAATVVVGMFSLYSYATGRKFYTAGARMLFSPGSQEIISDQQIVYQEWGSRDKKLNTHIDLLKSDKEVLRRVSEALEGRVSIGAIQGGIQVTRGETKGEETDIIELHYKNTDPELARDVLNLVCKNYVAYIREVKSQDVSQMIMKLEDQIKKVEADLRDKEDAMRQFKEDNQLVQVSAEASAVITKAADMQAALQQTELDLTANRERLTSIQGQIHKQDVDVVNSITYQDLYKTRLSELQFQLNTLLAEYGKDHFKVRMAEQEIEKIKDALRTNVTTKSVQSETFIKNPIRESLLQELVTLTIDKTSLEARRVAQEQLIVKLNSDVMKLPHLEQRFAQLQRQSDGLVQTLSMLKTQYEKTKIKRDSQETDLKILQLADLPRGGVSEVGVNRIYMGLAVGFLLGIALAFLIEYLDQTIKEPRDVERALELPLLGIVPFLEGEKALVDFGSDTGKARLEPFRVLRSNLKHLAQAHKLKTFIVCSAVKGEGKTTLAANLAITFAMDARKVILVDGDLRRPQIHSVFGMPKDNGLSDYMLGIREDIKHIIKATKYEGLSVITSGERPHNPTELLGTARFDQLVRELRELADIIIFDSPALLPVSDVITMAPKMDGCIIVTRTLWTPLKAARQAMLQLQRIGVNLLGTVLNGISHSRGYYPYYYGYYRYYSYKYTYEYDDEARKKPTLREFGLQAEAKIREGLQATVHSLPRYMALLGRTARHLAGSKMFWVLVLLLFASGMVRPWMAAQKRALFPRQPELVEPATPAAAPVVPSAPPAAAGQSLEALASVPPDEDSADRTFRQRTSGSCESALTVWQSALLSGDTAALLSAYDTAAFSFPGGAFTQWRSATSLQSVAAAGVLADTSYIESTAVEPVGNLHTKTSMTVATITRADTVRLPITQIWQWNNAGWHIIREKRGGAQ